MMKKYFVTGLVLLLPLALTLAIFMWAFNLLTRPFVGLMKDVFAHFGLLEHGFFFLSRDQVQHYLSQIIILALLFLFTVFLGMITRWFLFRYILRLWDTVLNHIPFVSSIYKTCKDVINTIFISKDNSFKQVVMVPFPSPETYTIGLVTQDNLPAIPKFNNVKPIAVFVPTTPNPTSGFLVVFKETDLVYLDMPVESALKFIISCGVIATPFKGFSKEAAQAMAASKQTAPSVVNVLDEEPV